MYQSTLFGDEVLTGIVNVASVPQRSPFRYPGGKTWLIPRIRQWLSPRVRERLNLAPARPRELIEPFAGGGIVGLTAAFERLADHITLVELDADVAAVWQTMLDADDGEWLAARILAFDVTVEAVAELLAHSAGTLQERAFQTIVKNRVNHGGILAPGSGVLKHGEGGKGLKSRWYPQTLARRIRDIATIRERITFIHGDGLEILAANADRPDVVFFIDPPYTVGGNGKRAGSRLYTHCALDHERLFAIAGQLQGDFLMTYDNAEEVRLLADHYGLQTRLIPMKNTHHAKMTELLIGPNLGWIG